MHYTTSCNTQSSAPEDGQNNCPKHVELTGIINKTVLLHLVGCLYYLKFCSFVTQNLILEFVLIRLYRTKQTGPCKSFSSNTDLKNIQKTNKYLVGISSFDRTDQLLKDIEF